MNRQPFWILLLVLLLAACLRLYHLNQQGLWGDEGWSVEFSDPHDPRTVTEQLVSDLHPPLYFILLSYWRQVAGDSVVAMRLLGVFPAILTVALVARLGRALFNPTAGMLAALMLAIADKHIVLSQEVRHYPLAFMWMTWCSVAYFQWLTKPTRTHTLQYAILMMLCVYTHYYAALIVMVQILYALLALRPWGRVGHLLLMTSIAMLAFLPWAAVAYYQLLIRPEGITHSWPRTWDTFDFLVVDFVGRPVALAVGLLLIGGLWRWRKPTPNYVLLWLGMPIVVTLAVYPHIKLITDRNLSLVLVPLALVLGRGLAAFPASGRGMLAVLVLANGLTSLDSYFDHPPVRELSVYIADHYPAGEPVLMDVEGEDKAMRYHLRDLLPNGTEIISLYQWRLDYEIYFLSVLETFLQEHDGFWIAYWVNQDRVWDVEEPLARNGYVRTASHRDYHLGYPIDVYHYDKVPAVDETIAQFGEDIRLHRVKVAYEVEQGEPLTVSLWWSTAAPLPISYSVSIFLLNEAGQLVVQGPDSPPQGGQAPTTAWVVDQIYFDSQQLDTQAVGTGRYQLAVKVYNSSDGAILPVGTNDYFVVETISIR